MEYLPLLIYFAGISNGIGMATRITAFVLSVASGLMIILFYGLKGDIASPYKEEHHIEKIKDQIISVKSGMRWCISGALIALFLNILTPSEKTIYAIAGTYGAVQIVNAPESKELMSKSLQVINLKLDSMINELTPTESKDNKKVEEKK